MKVLVIDDEPNVRQTVALVLGHLGHATVQANDFTSGLNALRETEPDCVLTDLNIGLDGYDGFDVIKSVRQLSPQTPVILMTADYDSSLASYAIDMGAAGFLQKPFGPADLQVALIVATQSIALCTVRTVIELSA